ncbi:dimethylaniline monooxygenase [N-oxide-forming] 2-like [Gigantopelta aegis]|uniref:dimethylaniline monooxygenase [N-oxide-forming] 2-like n=1 Tax=Gigantopelta aegis TaxID=1735272 RepID=UPI001B8889D2|nr:dimethylaniline monooxygenase [N-oxide-forming] 2-like [Gigantopelta aegis]
MICSGCLKRPRYPDIEGMDNFQGNIEHAMDFQTGEVYKKKKVVVVGNAMSAGDIASAVADYADQVYLSVGQGSILLRKFDENGIPVDMQLYKRIYYCCPMWTIPFLNNLIRNLSNIAIHHDLVGLHPGRDRPRSRLMVNEEIGLRIMTGKVKAVGRVVKMTERSVHIDDGTVVDDVDVVVFATGYDRHLPFLDNRLVDSAPAINEQKNEWYKLIFPIQLQHPTLAMIGMMTAEGPNLPVFEMQSRLAARVLCGKLKPSDRDVNDHAPEPRQMGMHQVPYLQYIDELAAEVGVKPTFWGLIWRHPRLAYLCVFGPASPVQYRLLGPHSNAEAINHCSAIYENTFSGVRHRRVPPQKPVTLLPTHLKILLPAVFRYMR